MPIQSHATATKKYLISKIEPLRNIEEHQGSIKYFRFGNKFLDINGENWMLFRVTVHLVCFDFNPPFVTKRG